MAFNFPDAPTTGDLYTPSGGPTYRWNGTTWVIAAPGAAIIVSDTPPASPVSGQMWWESDSGRLYVWFVDGTSSQWVQINAPVAPFPEAPADGGEYVRYNGAWRQKSQSKSLVGVNVATGVSFLVPDNVRGMQFRGFAASASSFAMNMQLSADGTTYLTGTGDYTTAGVYVNDQGSGAWAVLAATGNNGSAVLTVANSLASGYGAKFEGQMEMAKSVAGHDMNGFVRGSIHQATQYDNLYNFWLGSAASDNIMALKGARFGGYNGYSGTFTDGYVEVSWIY